MARRPGIFGRRPRDITDIAVEALARYPLRTSLSVLGVILGVAAVIAMMSVTEGARAEALQQMSSLGLDNLVARNAAGSAADGSGLTLADADRLRGLVPFAATTSALVERVAPVSRHGSRVVTTVLGVESGYQRILDLPVERGRFLSPLDDRRSRRVCVLGHTLARRLFGVDAAIGDAIRLQDGYCEVIGVLAPTSGDSRSAGALAWRDVNMAVMMPVAALTGQSQEHVPEQPVDEVWVRTTQGTRAEELGAVLAHSLSRLHPDAAPFEIVVPRELLAQRYRTQRTFGVVLGSIATIALVIGGIGIMNIMLTSVTERTREIGIRRAAGATRRDITAQFLAESLLMTLAGGVLGIGLGVLVSIGITAYAGWATRVSILAVGLGVSVSATVGLVFGLYPAMKAARFAPVDALHHE